MQHIIPHENKMEEEEGKQALGNFVNGVNRMIDFYDRNQITEILLFLLTGKKEKEMNRGIYKELYNYTKNYLDTVIVPKKKDLEVLGIDPIGLDITPEGKIKSILFGGKIIGSSLYYKPFTEDEIQRREKKGMNCCGAYPTLANPNSMLFTLDDKLITGDKNSFNIINDESVVFGPYYFNRNTIGREEGELTKIELIKEDELKETITSYDKNGLVVEKYENTFDLLAMRFGEYQARPRPIKKKVTLDDARKKMGLMDESKVVGGRRR